MHMSHYDTNKLNDNNNNKKTSKFKEFIIITFVPCTFDFIWSHVNFTTAHNAVRNIPYIMYDIIKYSGNWQQHATTERNQLWHFLEKVHIINMETRLMSNPSLALFDSVVKLELMRVHPH